MRWRAAPAICPPLPGPGFRRNRVSRRRSAARSPRRARCLVTAISVDIARRRAAPALAARAIWSRTSARRVAASLMRRAIGSAMAANQPPWPRDWLMTDERIGERLWDAIDRAAGGTRRDRRSAITRSIRRERLALGARSAGVGARARSWCWRSPAMPRLADELGAQLVHNPSGCRPICPFRWSVHDEREARAAREAGAALVFVSPVYRDALPSRRDALGYRTGGRLAAMCRLSGDCAGRNDSSAKFWEQATRHGAMAVTVDAVTIRTSRRLSPARHAAHDCCAIARYARRSA